MLELETSFDKFEQSGKTKSGTGGIGLALANCREIIQAHQGRIWADNNSDQGVIFTVLLPRHTSEESQ